jgi:hypothetical protein
MYALCTSVAWFKEFELYFVYSGALEAESKQAVEGAVAGVIAPSADAHVPEAPAANVALPAVVAEAPAEVAPDASSQSIGAEGEAPPPEQEASSGSLSSEKAKKKRSSFLKSMFTFKRASHDGPSTELKPPEAGVVGSSSELLPESASRPEGREGNTPSIHFRTLLGALGIVSLSCMQNVDYRTKSMYRCDCEGRVTIAFLGTPIVPEFEKFALLCIQNCPVLLDQAGHTFLSRCSFVCVMVCVQVLSLTNYLHAASNAPLEGSIATADVPVLSEPPAVDGVGDMPDTAVPDASSAGAAAPSGEATAEPAVSGAPEVSSVEPEVFAKDTAMLSGIGAAAAGPVAAPDAAMELGMDDKGQQVEAQHADVTAPEPEAPGEYENHIHSRVEFYGVEF